MQTGISQPESEAAAASAARMMSWSRQPVKMGGDEYNQYERDNKRSRVSSDSLQWGMPANTHPVQPQPYYPWDEPSPLGLKLDKNPSFVELIQAQLSQSNVNTVNTVKPANSAQTVAFDQMESKTSAGISDKLKASNIPAMHLKIGSWEYKSRHEGDLVAKCYFAKHKLVWEVLENGLKSKIEIQWSDITGLKADCPETGESLLKLVLARQPLFYKETNPQPRKHTLWQSCADFTDGEATVNRFHFLKFPQGTLQKHYEKLIQSDSRLDFLSRKPDLATDAQHFEGGLSSVIKELNPRSHFFDPIKAGESAGPGCRNAMPTVNTATAQPSFFKAGQQGHGGIMSERPPMGSFSPNSVNHIERLKNQTGEFQEAGKGSIDQLKEPAGLHTSMSKLDVMNCLVNDTIPSAADPSSAETVQRKDHQLEHLAEYLFNDVDSTPLPTDEKSVMTRVNSLCSLLQKDNVEGSNSPKENYCDTFINFATFAAYQSTENSQGANLNNKHSIFESKCDPGGQEPAENPSMVKKDSVSDLPLHLPHITSLPEFNDFSEDNQRHFN